MKKVFAVLVTAVLLLTVGCPKLEVVARDGIAAAQGVIETQQALHLASCQADPAQDVCVKINRAVSAQNAAADALSAYCGFGPLDPPDKVCVPVRSLESALRGALANLQPAIKNLKGAL
jgi:hypothetical protein